MSSVDSGIDYNGIFGESTELIQLWSGVTDSSSDYKGSIIFQCQYDKALDIK